MTTLVVGNPLLPNCLNEQLSLNELPHTEQEASMVAEMLQTKPFIKAQVRGKKNYFYIYYLYLIFYFRQISKTF